MNLKKKKELAARTLGVGIARISLNPERVDEIKEAITKQDIRDLVANSSIKIKPKKGRRKAKPGTARRGAGKVKKKINKRKHEYMRLTRKLRKHLKEMRARNLVNDKLYEKARKQIKAKSYRSLAHFKELIKK